MAIDHEIKRETGLHRIDDFDEGDAEGKGGKCVEDGPKRRWRLRATRSYHQILEDFEDRAQGNDPDIESPSTDGEGGDTASNVNRQSSLDVDLESTSTDLSSSPRKGDTMRRKQRFSLPAIALQTTSVTARTGGRDGGGKAKRFSLVLGSRGHGPGRNRNGTDQDKDSSSDLAKGVAAVRLNELLGRKP
jgi:hypothetical protein